MADQRTIISIYPRECRETRPGFRPTSVFVLPESPIGGKFSRLVIEPQVQSQYVGNGFHVDRSDATTPEKIAADLVRCWADNRAWSGIPAGARPGIWVAKEPNPTDEQVLSSPEYKRALQEQNRYFAEKVKQADLYWQRDKSTINIDSEHYLAADYLKITGRSWQHDNRREANKTCPFCGAVIPSGAMICRECKEIVDPERYAIEKRKRELVLAGSATPEKLPSIPEVRPKEDMQSRRVAAR